MSFRLLLLCVASALSVCAHAAPPNPTAEAQPGVCGTAATARVVAVDHTLYYPSEAAATAATKALDPKQFTATVGAAGGGKEWVVTVVHVGIPDLFALKAAKQRLDTLAQRTGGRYGQQDCRTE